MITWPVFERLSLVCRGCGLWKTSQGAVCQPGEGNPDAEIVLVGQSLGAEEEAQFRNFVGRAGQLLTSCIQEAGLIRAALWICNAVRCRPTAVVRGERRNRDPSKHEIAHCHSWLVEDLRRLHNKKVIVCLGKEAALSVLGELRGGVLENQGKVTWSEEHGCWVITTVHPSYVLRRQGEREVLVGDLEKARRWAERPLVAAPCDYRVAWTLEQAFQAKAEMLAASKFTFDWETNGLHPTKSIGFCLSLCAKERTAWVIPRYRSGMTPHWKKSDLQILDQEVIIPILTSDVPKGGHHVSFDMSISETTVRVVPRNVKFCTMTKHHLWKNHLGTRMHRLKMMADLYTDMGRYDDKLDAWLIANGYVDRDGKPNHGYIYKAPDEITHLYAAKDADATFRIDGIIDVGLAEGGVVETFPRERLPLILTHREMDREGVRVDVDYARDLANNLDGALGRTTAALSEIAGREVNPNSYPQMGKLFFEELGLPVLGYTDTGGPSTREEYLVPVRDIFPAVPILLQHRAYNKLKGYVEGRDGNTGLLSVVDEDGYARMYTFLIGTETFRFVTRRPFAIHTFPKTAPGMPSVRGMIIPDPGYVFDERDFSQQEWAVQAIVAEQWDMVEAILEHGMDVHEYVMRELGGITKAQFQDGQGEWLNHDAELAYKQARSIWKSVNFMVLYRGGHKKLARATNRSEEEAIAFIQDYSERFDKIRWWQYERIKEVRRTGMVRGLFGTYRKLPGIYDGNKYTQLEAERAACNTPIQDGGAHVMIRCLIQLQEKFRQLRFPGKVKFTMHDQLISQIREDLVEEGGEIITSVMEQGFPELAGRSIRTDRVVTQRWGG